MSTATKLFAEIITEEKQKQVESSRWGNSIFEEIDELKNDYSGRAGEVWVHELCNHLGIDNQYNADEVNQEDGTYDITIKIKTTEVKTARVGTKEDNWQHESLRDHGCDFFWFNDVVPEGVYVTIIPANFDFTKKHPILGRTPHLRKETGGTYKLDFGRATLRRGLAAGVTKFIDENTTDEEIKNFIDGRIK